MESETEPQALQIIKSNENNILILNDELLQHILTIDEVKNRYISVVSITGVFRQGKSFLLNFLLRYLRVKYVQKRDVKDWLSEGGPLTGFSWSAGSKRHTTGIQMWSEIFLTTLPSGEKVAIILLDTQGAFDNQTTVGDCATIFALSTLISSVQIHNVMRNIKQYDLTHLQCFGGYGKLMSNEAQSAPFQNMILLVRDWPCPYEKPYGAQGGDALLREIFSSKDKPSEINEQVETVKALFNEITCFLLPYPGRAVDASNSFKGDLKDVSGTFKKHVQELVKMILAPENLIVKTINGEKIKGEHLVCYIQEYTKILKEGQLPKVETIFKATVEAHHKTAFLQSLKLYKKIMDCDCKLNPKIYTPDELNEKHGLIKVKAVDHYQKLKKFDDKMINDKYLVELKNKMDNEYAEYRKANEEKQRESQQRKMRMLERIDLSLHSALPRNSVSLANLSTVEKVGTAAAVIGGIAVLALSASRLLSNQPNSD